MFGIAEQTLSALTGVLWSRIDFNSENKVNIKIKEVTGADVFYRNM